MTADPLAGLRDWHLPEPISWWPPAPGWWLLAATVLILAGLLVHWLLRRYRRASLRRTARRELEALRRNLGTGQDARLYIAGLSRLLRRLALVRYPRERVAGLSGRDWLEFLDTTGGQGGFAQGAGRVLVEDAYRPARGTSHTRELDELDRLAGRWVEANLGGRS